MKILRNFDVCAAVVLSAVVLSGCSSLDGLGGSNTLSCPIPNGSTCTRMSDAYQETVYGTRTTNKQAGNTTAPAAKTTETTAAGAPARPVHATQQMMPLRSAPRTLRMWIAPWKDTDGDLVDESRAYVKIDDGDWQIDHIRADKRKGQVTSFVAPPRTQANGEAKATATGPTDPMVNSLFKPAAPASPTEN